MAKKFLLQIITPEKIFFEGEVDQLIVEAVDGKLGILADHTYSVFGVIPCEVEIRIGEELKTAACGSGFIQVKNNVVKMLSETCVWPYEVDADNERREIERSNELMRQKESYREYLLGKASLARSFAKLKISGRSR